MKRHTHIPLSSLVLRWPPTTRQPKPLSISLSSNQINCPVFTKVTRRSNACAKHGEDKVKSKSNGFCNISSPPLLQMFSYTESFCDLGAALMLQALRSFYAKISQRYRYDKTNSYLSLAFTQKIILLHKANIPYIK